MKCPHTPRLRLHLPGLLSGPHSPFSFQPSVPPRRAECARAAFYRAFLRSPEVVAAQGRQMRHNSRVAHSTIYHSSKSAQILVGPKCFTDAIRKRNIFDSGKVDGYLTIYLWFSFQIYKIMKCCLTLKTR